MPINVTPNYSKMEQPRGKREEYEEEGGKGWELTLLSL
jgi:hypothetical protein